MRRETRTKQVIEEVFVSDDGEVFNKIEDCVIYENERLYEKCKKEIGQLPHFSVYSSDIDEDYSVCFYLVFSIEELNKVKHGTFTVYDASGWEFELDKFPCWIRVVVNDYGYGYITTLDDEIQAANNYIDEITRRRIEIEEGLKSCSK